MQTWDLWATSLTRRADYSNNQVWVIKKSQKMRKVYGQADTWQTSGNSIKPHLAFSEQMIGLKNKYFFWS